MLRAGWLATVAVFAALAVATGPWLIAAGLAFGVLAGLTEGSEKALLADGAPKTERGVTFGAMAISTAVTGLIGNAAGGLLLVWWGPAVFLVLAVAPLAALALLGRRRST
jgi:MFS family permease